MNSAPSAIAENLRKVFAQYQVANIRGISPEAFAKYIQSRIGVVDAAAENYSAHELEQQRDLSIKFHWGHNHDFATFQIQGRMGDRHINLLADFLSLFPIRIEDFAGKRVFDIGCWTGGTTLLLAALAQSVLAIEEVKKYAEMTNFLTQSFGLQDRVTVSADSIYECNKPEFYDQFDIVYFPGVLYHLSDPLLALRILFNSLKPGGVMLVETMGINHPEPLCRFDGSLITHSGTRERMNRRGWNWFVPSASALQRMMREAGLEEIQTLWHEGAGRVYGYGKKVSQVGICKAGLSVPGIR